MSRKPDLAKRAAWRKRFAAFDRQALSVEDFCWREGVSVASFYQWRRKLRGASERSSVKSGRRKTAACAPAMSSAFLPIEITGLSATANCVEVLFPGGPRLRIPCHESQAIRTVIAALTGMADVGETPIAAEVRRC